MPKSIKCKDCGFFSGAFNGIRFQTASPACISTGMPDCLRFGESVEEPDAEITCSGFRPREHVLKLSVRTWEHRFAKIFSAELRSVEGVDAVVRDSGYRFFTGGELVLVALAVGTLANIMVIADILHKHLSRRDKASVYLKCGDQSIKITGKSVKKLAELLVDALKQEVTAKEKSNAEDEV